MINPKCLSTEKKARKTRKMKRYNSPRFLITDMSNIKVVSEWAYTENARKMLLRQNLSKWCLKQQVIS